jgi:hypothetical protein
MVRSPRNYRRAPVLPDAHDDLIVPSRRLALQMRLLSARDVRAW